MRRKLTPHHLTEAVNGDMGAFALVREQPHDVIRRCREMLPELVLPAAAVSAVLTALRLGQIAPELAQSWASFVRRGYVAGTNARPLRPIDIQYDPRMEEEIVEALARLDHLGEALDGAISGAESEALIQSLSH